MKPSFVFSTRSFALTVLISAALLSLAADVFAEENPAEKWRSHIDKFVAEDEANGVKENGVLFVGSSSIRMWKTASAFPEMDVLNRGFGGSQISDVNHFVEQLVLKHKPRVVAFYAGDNDIANGKTADQVFVDYKQFLTTVGEHLPQTQVVFIPIKPSVKRWDMWAKMKVANDQIKDYTYRDVRWHYVDIATPMFGEDGKPMEDLFADDGLHLNDKGYEVWNAIVARQLRQVSRIQSQTVATGVVYHDNNHNQKLDDGEKRLAGIRVSNGREIVTTDDQGRYKLTVDNDDIVFVVKPSGWRTPLSKDLLPQFYYIHKPAGSRDLKYKGVEATGPLPESIDFPLYPQKEPQKFQAIMFGDPQPRDQKEVDYIAHDVVEELIGTKASFGVTLGDIMFDNLDLFEPNNQVIAMLGIPWYNVIGNHDINYDAKNDHESDETFERVYGPAYYSFDYGSVHFVVVDDVEWYVKEEGKRGTYRGGLGEEQMEFIRNDLAVIPENQLVVLMMHIPLIDVRDRQELYRLIERRPFCMSISGHTHHHEHRYITKKDGWQGAEPHHHVINVTVSGSWWGGAPDERGIPHTLMADGAPNGYTIISFDGEKYHLDYKVAGKPADYQMRIHLPEEIEADKLGETMAYVNVFNGSEKSKVEMQLAGSDKWLEMNRSVEADPHYKAIQERDNAVKDKTWRNLPGPKPSPHLWKLNLPSDLPIGAHLLQIKTTDRLDRIFRSARTFRVIATAPVEIETKENGSDGESVKDAVKNTAAPDKKKPADTDKKSRAGE
jgi:lysophospholipase L1-like esterase